MATQSGVAIAPHRFAYGFYRQVWWDWLIGVAFFCGGLGAGLFLISLLTHEVLGMVVGYLIVTVGKNTAHLFYLGRPLRFWRAAMRPDRSWIARGIWAMGLFAITGFLCFAPYLLGAGWHLSGLAGTAVTWIAGLSALFIMFYDGFVMNSSGAIPFWNSLLLPVLILMYASLGGTTLSLTLRALFGVGPKAVPALSVIEPLLLVINFALLGLYLFRMSGWEPAARETVKMLVRGSLAWAFLGLVLAVGLGATLLLSFAAERFRAEWLLPVIAVCELTGDFALLMVWLRSGLFSPQTAPRYQTHIWQSELR